MNIIISGASQGIGRACVLEFCQNKDHRVIALSRNAGNLSTLKEEAKGANVIPLAIDLTDRDYSELDTILRETGHIDILINNAGLMINKAFQELTHEDWLQQFETNVFAPAALIRQLLPVMGISGHSHIVNIGSMGGFQGSVKFPGLSAYSSSKAALASMTECLAEEFKDRNITVNCLALGAVQTEMLSQRFPDFKAPLESHEMASYIYDFCMNGYRYFNGKVLPVAVSTP